MRAAESRGGEGTTGLKASSRPHTARGRGTAQRAGLRVPLPSPWRGAAGIREAGRRGRRALSFPGRQVERERLGGWAGRAFVGLLWGCGGTSCPVGLFVLAVVNVPERHWGRHRLPPADWAPLEDE